MRSIVTPPRSLVHDGRLQFGTYAGAIEQLNALDADVGSLLPWPRPLKALRLKEWQAFQFGSDELFGMVALFNAKVLALVQLKIYDRRARRKILYEAKVPPWSLRLPHTLLDSTTRYDGRGCAVTFRNRLRSGRLEIRFDVARGWRRPRLSGELTAWADRADPMVVCQPFGRGRGMYSHKGLMPAEGTIRIGERELRLSAGDSHVLMDDHKGFYPYVMRWDWVTAAGRDAGGRLMGLNLTRNQCIDPERYNENGFWVDGRLHLLPPVRFERSCGAAGGSPERWRVRDADGQVDLRFDVQIDGRVDVNALVVRSKYRGPFGTFSGHLVAEDGAQLDVDHLFGMGEDFYLRC